jgi:dodecin
MQSVGRITELTATSEHSFDEAIRLAMDRASTTLRGLKSAIVKEQEVLLTNGRIAGYRVNLAVTFVLDEYGDEIRPAIPDPATQTADFAT